MKIALLTHFCAPEPCAAANRVDAWCVALSELGHQVTIVTGFPAFPAGKLAAADRGVIRRDERTKHARIVRLWTPDPSRLPGGRLASWISGALAASAYLLFTRERFDIILVTVPPITLVLPAILGKIRHGGTLITDVRDVFPDIAVAMGEWRENSLLTRAVGALARVLYRSSHAVVAVTRTAMTQIAARGAACERLFLAPNGFEQCTESTVRPPGNKRFTALYAGNIGTATGIDVLLEAAQLLADEAIDVLIVGDGADAARVRRRITDEGLNNVRMTGAVPRERALELLRLSDAAVVPLRSGLRDTIPTKIFDALALARPVIVCADGEAATLATSSGGGIAIAPGDARALAGSLRSLASAPQECEAMGSRGQAYVRARFERHTIMRVLCERIVATVRGPQHSA